VGRDETVVIHSEITDTSTSKKHACLKHRWYKQGPVVFDIDFKDTGRPAR